MIKILSNFIDNFSKKKLWVKTVPFNALKPVIIDKYFFYYPQTIEIFILDFR
jgi:hypothetical protein